MKKMLVRALSLVLVITMFLAMSTTAFAAGFGNHIFVDFYDVNTGNYIGFGYMKAEGSMVSRYDVKAPAGYDVIVNDMNSVAQIINGAITVDVLAKKEVTVEFSDAYSWMPVGTPVTVKVHGWATEVTADDVAAPEGYEIVGSAEINAWGTCYMEVIKK